MQVAERAIFQYTIVTRAIFQFHVPCTRDFPVLRRLPRDFPVSASPAISSPIVKAGYAALAERYRLHAPRLPREARFAGVAYRQERETPRGVLELFPHRYASGKASMAQVEFALKYESLNLALLYQIFQRLPPAEIASYIAQRPNSPVLRRIWFWYEWLLDARLSLPDLARRQYVDLLSPTQYYAVPGVNEPRYKIRNNTLGSRSFCPIVRRTQVLQQYERADFPERCAVALKDCPPLLYNRVLSHLYLAETRSSFLIEQEEPSPNRTQRFIRLLQQAEREDYVSREGFRAVLRAILPDSVSDRALSVRTHQNFVGHSTLAGEIVDLAPARPQDLPTLMAGLIASHRQLEAERIAPVVHAAVVSFSLVFIHPFADGNGRLHRFLLHNILARRGYTPPGAIFPVSASIVNDPTSYEEALLDFSRGATEAADFAFDAGFMTIRNDTAPYFRYPDMTRQAEFLYRCLEDALATQVQGGRDFLERYDRAKKGMAQQADMPDRQVNLFITLCRNNGGYLAKGKRKRLFRELSDDEVRRLEQEVRSAFGLSARARPAQDG